MRAPRSLGFDSQNDEADNQSKMVRALRLWAEGNDQRTIARDMDVGQTTVSRWINDARDFGMIETLIFPPSVPHMEDRMRMILQKRGISQVSVVPSDAAMPVLGGAGVGAMADAGGSGSEFGGKNAENIGSRAARLIFNAISGFDKDDIKIVLSCGITVQTAVATLTRLLRSNNYKRKVQGKNITLYPSAVFADWRQRAEYPHSLVIAMNVELRGDLNIESKAPILPPKFYKLKEYEQIELLNEYEVSPIMQEARNADMFIIGIGTVSSPSLRRVYEMIGVDTKTLSVLNGNPDHPEIGYVPFPLKGNDFSDIRRKIPGITVDDLISASKSPGKIVMGLAGGVRKARAVTSILNFEKGPGATKQGERMFENVFNNLVIDADIGREFLDQFDKK